MALQSFLWRTWRDSGWPGTTDILSVAATHTGTTDILSVAAGRTGTTDILSVAGGRTRNFFRLFSRDSPVFTNAIHTQRTWTSVVPVAGTQRTWTSVVPVAPLSSLPGFPQKSLKSLRSARYLKFIAVPISPTARKMPLPSKCVASMLSTAGEPDSPEPQLPLDCLIPSM